MIADRETWHQPPPRIGQIEPLPDTRPGTTRLALACMVIGSVIALLTCAPLFGSL
jgi:hypothetical protein